MTYIKKHVNLTDSYETYSSVSDEPLICKDYLIIVKEFMKFLSTTCIEKGEILLPEGLGKIVVIGRTRKAVIKDGLITGLPVNWKETKELWARDKQAEENKQLVFYFNEETNGVIYKFSWRKSRVLVPNKSLYNVVMTRKNKRTLSSRVQEGKEYLITS